MSQAPDMSAVLFETYGTNKTASHTTEDQQKVAEAELFMGLCKSAGIDPAHLTDEQVSALWKAAAGSEEKPEDKKKKEEEAKQEEKKASATREWQEKRATAEKVAEADALGRIMAHSYVDELKKIAEAGKEAALPPQFMQNMKGKGEEKPAEGKPEGKSDDKGKEEKGDKDKDEDKKKESQDRANALIAKLASGSTSTTPNLDEQAALHAVEMLKSAGHNGDVALARVSAVHTLGLQESAKIASANTPDTALALRALEYCEAAGYPVDWTKV